MPKREIMVADGRGGWRKQSVDVRRQGALESEAACERNIALDITRMFGHEGVGWTVEHGTRAAQRDFNALMAVTRGSRVTNVQDLLSALNRPAERRPHHNKYERFSKRGHR